MIIPRRSQEERAAAGAKGTNYIHGDQRISILARRNTKTLEVVADVTLGKEAEGPYGYAHGGAVATVLDTVAADAVFGYTPGAVTASMNVDYKKPVPLDRMCKVRCAVTGKARTSRGDADKFTVECRTTSEDGATTYNEAKLLFIGRDHRNLPGHSAPQPHVSKE